MKGQRKLGDFLQILEGYCKNIFNTFLVGPMLQETRKKRFSKKEKIPREPINLKVVFDK
jgi:hypothetical protein